MAHRWNADSFRCGCELCADVPEADRAGEPGQDPCLWCEDPPKGRQHVVLSRLFDREKVFDFVIRHMGGLGSGGDGWFRYGNFQTDGYDSDAVRDGADPEAWDEPVIFPHTSDSAKNLHRGVILWLNGETGRDKYAGRVGSYYMVYPPGFEGDESVKLEYLRWKSSPSRATAWA